jgi:hypothetical protein
MKDELTLVDVERVLRTMPPDFASDHTTTTNCTLANVVRVLTETPAIIEIGCSLDGARIGGTRDTITEATPYIPFARPVRRLIFLLDNVAASPDHSRYITVAEALDAIDAIKGE